MSNQDEHQAAAETGQEAGSAPEVAAVHGKIDSAGEAVMAATQSRIGFMRVLATVRGWWRDEVIGAVDHEDVIAKRRDECAMSEHYLFMTAMSAGIAVIGLLQSSTAVVIGAMLLSPLMGPIMGLGFALGITDYQWLKQSSRSLFWGSVMAIALCALLVFLSPVKTITPEIAARTQPNLFDLFVALFSGLAGAYAMIRGRAGAIVGVAIATALMPPLAVVGFGLATFNWTVFSGALLLYVTNLVTIALTAWALAKLYGFRGSLSQRQSQFQNGVIILVFIALAVPLALSLRTIAWEANAQRIVRDEITEEFEGAGRLSELDLAFSDASVGVSATMFNPEFRPEADANIARALRARLGREVEVSLTQVPTGTNSVDAEEAELAAVRAIEERAASARVSALASRLSLVAGVSEDEVTIDAGRRRATVRATELDGASLSAYRALEMRIAATEPDWVIELLPPIGDLPGNIAFEEDAPTAEGEDAIEIVAWAAKRIGLPVVLEGSEDDAIKAAELLAERGVSVTVEPGSGPLRAEWGGR
ncbi:TIGR00341 family protein [uncultured Erythrobacter sp.]|uniref:TIGR00341 family protein n=1 Tax=uncultured Erythrobacter sp. TaxID=263913 RepID=UPI0026072781|nr:TIGR00341 family protein [uncultured Erythrobacter sp.]